MIHNHVIQYSSNYHYVLHHTDITSHKHRTSPHCTVLTHLYNATLLTHFLYLLSPALYLFQGKEVQIITVMQFQALEQMPDFSRPLLSVKYGIHGYILFSVSG